MPKSPDRLAKEFVDVASELYRRRLWNDVPGDAVFLLRVPTEDFALAATVMGQAGQEFGLAIARGEHAFSCMSDMCTGEGAERFAESGDLMSITFDPWGKLPDEFRQPLIRAGIQPRRERVVPVALVKCPYEHPRFPNRTDLRTLVWILRGVLAAHDADELRALVIPALDSNRNEVLELEIAGPPKKPTVQARVVPRPKDTSPHDVPPLAMLPPGLEDLPRLRERWMVALFPTNAAIRGDSRTVFGIFVAAENGPILANGVALGDELAPVAETLAEAFRGEGHEEPPGLPRELVFDDPRLYESLAPALAGLDVHAVLDEEYPPLLDLVDALQSSEHETMDPSVPEGLLQWKDVSLRVTARLVEMAEGKSGPSDRAFTRYFGSQQDARQALSELEDCDPAEAFVEWLIADYRATKRSKTILEKALAAKSLDPEEKAVLEARKACRLSFFRVDSSEPSGMIEVEDVLSGERLTLYDKAMSDCELEDMCLPLRLVLVDDWIFPFVAGPPLNSFEAVAAMEELEHLGVELSAEGLRRDAHLTGRLWSWCLRHLDHPPELSNTDSETLELQTATFQVADCGALERGLEEHHDVRFDEESGEWDWLREGAPGGTAGNTVLGRMQLLDDRLVLEVNSAERLAMARAFLETIPGVSFERSTKHSLESSERPLDDQLPGPPTPPPTAEMIEAFERFANEHYLHWLDDRVPLLGDLTPREACATPEGRRKVARLVRAMPAIETPGGRVAVPRETLFRELGITSDGTS